MKQNESLCRKYVHSLMLMFSNPSFIWNVTHNCKWILRSMFHYACASFNVRLPLKDWSSVFHHTLVHKREIWDSMKQVNIRPERVSYLLCSRSKATCSIVIEAYCSCSTKIAVLLGAKTTEFFQKYCKHSTFSFKRLHIYPVLRLNYLHV